ncbi:MAG: MotA/TolQ/ExbB proton channel family protein [Gammaproteobacteria bacterium]|nr:MotA/TolQ/ExbB proton channel family protein [Gammaproteobacteria bacterium]
MNRLTVTLFLLLTIHGTLVSADHPTSLDHLLRQVEEAHRQDARIRKEREQRFLQAQQDQQTLLEELRGQVAAQRDRGQQLRQQHTANETALQTLQTELNARSGNLGELFGTVRHTAGDLQALLRDSLVSAQYPERAEWLDTLAKSKKLPGITELERFWLLLQQEINQSGQVSRFMAPVTGTDGITNTQQVIRISVFTAIADGQYLHFQPEQNRFTVLSRQPTGNLQKMAASFAMQDRGYAPMVIDPTRGGLLSMLTQTPTPVERIQQGGAIGYIILAIGLFGIVLVLLRLTGLGRVAGRMDRQLREPGEVADDNPLGRVLLAAGDAGDRDIDAIELLLDEAILRETPALQRGLGLLKLLAAVAPLLGLLGTVTGMILTFQSITLFGTGDPKLMAGGISQALVTTVLGLIVAIPLLFSHTLLASRSRTLIQILDEQSAGLIARQVSHRD